MYINIYALVYVYIYAYICIYIRIYIYDVRQQIRLLQYASKETYIHQKRPIYIL